MLLPNKISDLNLLAAGVNNVIAEKYPQIAKRIVYPLRDKHFEIIQETWKKAYNQGRYNQTKIRNVEEENAKTEYRNALVEAQREKAKNFLLVAQKDTNEIPESVKNAMISLKLYQTIPVINGRLMCPGTQLGVNTIRDTVRNVNLPIFAKNGDLMPLTPRKLRCYLAQTHRDDEVLNNVQTLKKVPEYRIISTYINNPSKLGKLQKILDNDKQAFENPKKMAARIKKKVFEYMNNNQAPLEAQATSKISPGDLIAYNEMRDILRANNGGNINYFGSDPKAPSNISDFLIKKRVLRQPNALFTKVMSPEQKFLIDYGRVGEAAGR